MDHLQEIIRYATLAPSSHNTQPWQFEIEKNHVRILPDRSRELPVVDPDDHALFISLGCALENLVIAAGHYGYAADVHLPSPRQEAIVVTLRPTRRRQDLLFAQIERRQSNRAAYDGQPIPQDHLRQLLAAGHDHGVQSIAASGAQTKQIIALAAEAAKRQYSDKRFVDELAAWVRFSRREAQEHRDGITAEAIGVPWVPRWIGERVMRLTASRQPKEVVRLLESASALLLFAVEKEDKAHWIMLGRSFQRVALTATALGISLAHMNMPCEVPSVREQLRKELKIRGQPLLLVRIGYATPAARSPRREVEEVLRR